MYKVSVQFKHPIVEGGEEHEEASLIDGTQAFVPGIPTEEASFTFGTADEANHALSVARRSDGLYRVALGDSRGPVEMTLVPAENIAAFSIVNLDIEWLTADGVLDEYVRWLAVQGLPVHCGNEELEARFAICDFLDEVGLLDKFKRYVRERADGKL